MEVMKIYKRAHKNPYAYLGQCDRLRRNNPIGEKNWQKMIENHVKVSMEEFMSQCDWKAIVDEGEEGLDDFMIGDPDAYFAKSVWGDKNCYYLMHAGFEFIFVK